jgi:hypothetical protein
MSEETEVVTPVVEAALEAEHQDASIAASAAEDAASEAAATEQSTEDPALSAHEREARKLRGRVGYLTKTRNEQEAQLAELRRQNEAYQALLAQGGTTPQNDGETPPARTPANGERTFTQAEVREEARRLAAAETFNAQADAAYEAGKAKFTDFDDAVATLRDVGAMTQPLVEAALATGEAPAVLHYLGNDPDEAARITALNPVRMGVELAKIAGKLAAAPKPRTVSAAPPPIRTVGGTAKPEIDVYDPKLAMGDHVSPDYIAARQKQGSMWAKPDRSRR